MRRRCELRRLRASRNLAARSRRPPPPRTIPLRPPDLRQPRPAHPGTRLRIAPTRGERPAALRVRAHPLERATLRGVLGAAGSVPRIDVVAVSLPPRTRRNDMRLTTPRVEPVTRPRIPLELLERLRFTALPANLRRWLPETSHHPAFFRGSLRSVFGPGMPKNCLAFDSCHAGVVDWFTGTYRLSSGTGGSPLSTGTQRSRLMLECLWPDGLSFTGTASLRQSESRWRPHTASPLRSAWGTQVPRVARASAGRV